MHELTKVRESGLCLVPSCSKLSVVFEGPTSRLPSHCECGEKLRTTLPRGETIEVARRRRAG